MSDAWMVAGAVVVALVGVDASAFDPAVLRSVWTRAHQVLTDLADWSDVVLAVSFATFAGALVGLLIWPYLRGPWHHFANTHWVGKPCRLMTPRVIDGDTIHDLATGDRYRLANIDAPETDAKCGRERGRAEVAKRQAIVLIEKAAEVSVRRTFRKDHYGRQVAFVLVDGQDLGELLMQRGLAVAWQGARKRWCGPNGGLAKIAARGGPPHDCQTCRNWR